MCQGCGEEYFETHKRPRLSLAMAGLAELIARNDADYRLTRGALHIVIGDWNLGASHIKWCLGPKNSSAESLTDLEREIGEGLLALSLAERYVVMDRAEELEMERRRAARA